MITFCEKNQINHEVCGKFVVISNNSVIGLLNNLVDEGAKDGSKKLKFLNSEGLKQLEPNVNAQKALKVPLQGIVVYKHVMKVMAEYIFNSRSIICINCNIENNVVVSPEFVLGKNVKIQNNVSIFIGVICYDVFLYPFLVFTYVTNPRSAINRRGQYAKTHVGNGASTCANATIVFGYDIGEYDFIGAGAVVTKTIPALHW